MEHRPLGRIGVQVSKLCLGTMMLGEWGTKDHAESIKIINAALDAGITFVDTADVYSQGESEVIVGEALKGRRDDVVLATKSLMPFGDDPRRRGASRRWIMQAVENSLRRLDTDYLDLYQIHRWDPDVDLDETLGALTDLMTDWGPLDSTSSSIWTVGDQQTIARANDVVAKCGEVFGASTARTAAVTLGARIKRWVIGERWDEEAVVAHEHALRQVAEAPRLLVEHFRVVQSRSSVDLFMPTLPSGADGK